MKSTLIIIFSSFYLLSFAQNSNITSDISAIVFLDSFVVTATKQGFSIDDFIDIVQKDESFFRAFHNLRFTPHLADNKVTIFNKKQQIKAANHHQTQQFVEGNCRSMTYLSENIQGKYFKKKRKHRYYTAQMHEQIFLTKGKICGAPSNPSISANNLNGIQKHINELKKLIFQPGKEVDVPFIGGKTAIFKEDMLKYYNFSIISKAYKNRPDCFVFRAVAKPSYRSGKTIIKYLETYFDKNDFQVLARNYHLKYSGLFDFDVKMKVELTQLGDKYLPALVTYDGNWKIPTQRREIVDFSIGFDYN
ncbi:MAG: hypothetical protein AB8G86_19830 [Saprospiraceae bacterium]